MTFDCNQNSMEIWVVAINFVFHNSYNAPTVLRNICLERALGVVLWKHVTYYDQAFRVVT